MHRVGVSQTGSGQELSYKKYIMPNEHNEHYALNTRISNYLCSCSSHCRRCQLLLHTPNDVHTCIVLFNDIICTSYAYAYT